MLDYHLNESIDLSSRNKNFINQSAKWIMSYFGVNQNTAIILGVVAILALIISLPVEWMTITNTQMQFNSNLPGFNDMMNQSFSNMSAKVTGINGNITLLIKLPIWLIIAIGLIGVVLALVNGLQAAAIPTIAALIPLILSTIYVIAALVIATTSAEASVGIGAFIALVGLGLGYAVAMYNPESQHQEPNPE